MIALDAHSSILSPPSPTLTSYGVAFVSLRDNLDLSTPSGRLMFHVVAAMAEFERELIRERVRAGLANARSKGVTLGRRRTAVDAATVARLRSEGSWAEVCRKLDLSKGTAQRAAQSVAEDVIAKRVAD